MTHVEAIESRTLMAATGLDTTFGTTGQVKLPSGTLGKAVLSVPGAVFVAANSKQGVNSLYKLKDSGTLDVKFGDHGHIETPNFSISTLAYDKRFGLLYAAGVTVRYTTPDGVNNDNTDGNTATLHVERFDAGTGAVDAGFGTAGMASYRFDKANTDAVNTVTIGRLQPLAKRGLVVALDHFRYVDVFGAAVTRVNDVVLMKYTAHGTADSAFSKSGIVKAATGVDVVVDASRYSSDTMNTQQFEDLQAQDDGGFRVITSGTHGTTVLENTDEEHVTNHNTYTVSSITVTAAGTVDTKHQINWWVAINTPDDYVGIDPGDFRPKLVQAIGTDDAVVFGVRTVRGNTQSSTVTTLTPAARTVNRLIIPSNRFEDRVVPYAHGYYVLSDVGSTVFASKFKSNFRLTPSYNNGDETATPVTDDLDGAVATDIDGKLLVLHENQLSRISG